MLAATSTYAGQAELSLEGRVGADSNVLRRPTSPKAAAPTGGGSEAAYFEIAPAVRFSQRRDPFTYSVGYRGVRQQFFGRRELTGWDHAARGNATWRVTPRDTIKTSATYRDERRLRLGAEIDPSDPTRLVARESDRQRIRFSLSNASYTHDFDRRKSLTLSFNFQDINFVPNSNPAVTTIDTRSYTLSASPSFVLDEKTRVGFGVTGRLRRSFGKRFLSSPVPPPAQIPAGADSQVISGNVSLQLSRQLSEKSSVSLSAGPTILRSEIRAAASSLASNRKDDSTDFSWFAQANYSQQWSERTRMAMTYSRFESASGGQGASSIVDQASITFNHRPAERWSMRLVGSWFQRNQVVNSSVLNAQDQKTSRYQTIASARYQIAKRVYLTSQFQYRYQTQQIAGRRDSVSETFLGFIGIRYTFEPLDY